MTEVTTAPAASDQQTQLAELCAQATLQYSIKNYAAAAELYAQATELQALINGELATQNADLLYQYGRCLYHVGVSKSDVLGGRVAGEQDADKGEKPVKKAGGSSKTAADQTTNGEDRIAEEVVTRAVEEKDSIDAEKEKEAVANKPYFQFTGDENFDDSEDEEGEGEEAGAEEEEVQEDDFANAYEALDLARVLFERRIEELQGEDKGKGKIGEESDQVRQLKERLADTHDLQAEISLENEQFPNAVTDFKAALVLKQGLFPKESSLIAEAHYKLSLALEFASVTTQKTEDGQPDDSKDATVDEAMREEAAKEMEAAIQSCKLRVKQEESQLASGDSKEGNDKKKKVTQESIDDVKEMIADMEQRLVELRKAPMSVAGATGPAGAPDGTDPLSGILGSILGESPAAQKARIEEATKTANDLTGLVRKKKPATDEKHAATDLPRENGVNGQAQGKRKVEVMDEGEDVRLGKKSRAE